MAFQSGGDALPDFMALSAIDNRWPVPWHLILPGEDSLGITPLRTAASASRTLARRTSAG
jgi:hypothetical protein